MVLSSEATTTPQDTLLQDSRTNNDDMKFILSKELKHVKACSHCLEKLQKYLDELENEEATKKQK